MTTGENIGRIANEKGISLRKLSILSGIPYTTLYSIVKRKSDKIDIDILRKIALALDLHPIEIMGERPASMVLYGMDLFERATTEKSGIEEVKNKPMHQMTADEVMKQPWFHMEFKSDDDHIAYLYSLLNGSGRAEATRCFSRHLDKDAIPEVIEYLQHLASTPQFTKKPKE